LGSMKKASKGAEIKGVCNYCLARIYFLKSTE